MEEGKGNKYLYSVYNMPGTVLSSFTNIISFVPHKTLSSGYYYYYYYYPNFTDEETEANRG